jgi:hypothetical protein
MSPAMRLPKLGHILKKKKKDFVIIYIKEVWFSSPKFLNFKYFFFDKLLIWCVKNYNKIHPSNFVNRRYII